MSDHVPHIIKNWIQTSENVQFDLANPAVESFKLEDIAHALSHLCRYTGHTKFFYSVAEHSIRVAYYMLDLVMREFPDSTPKQQLEAFKAGLMHDASEAYLGDVSSPLKRLPAMAGYVALEDLYQERLRERFKLHEFKVIHNGKPYSLVREADLQVLQQERGQLLGTSPADWGDFKLMPALTPTPVFPDHDEWGWHSELVRIEFLELAEWCGVR